MKIKLADYVINYFADLGVDKAFIVYGAANGDIVDAFTRTNKIQYVAVMHEQAGGFAAEGFAKVREKNTWLSFSNKWSRRNEFCYPYRKLLL